jgi:hypothetical protein
LISNDETAFVNDTGIATAVLLDLTMLFACQIAYDKRARTSSTDRLFKSIVACHSTFSMRVKLAVRGNPGLRQDVESQLT